MLSRIEKRCIDKGLKMTGQRRVIAQVLSAANDHPDAEELHRRASSIDDKISMATVYHPMLTLYLSFLSHASRGVPVSKIFEFELILFADK